MYWHEIDSPVGQLRLIGTEHALVRLHFQAGPHRLQPANEWRRAFEPFMQACTQLAEYFRGVRRSFQLSLAPAGTPFQLAVWRELCAIPYGETVSYAQLARRLQLESGARAVGMANGANPLPILVPCHRVIGADGTLTGFGGGLHIKRSLLALEGAACVTDLFASEECAALRARPPT